MAVRTTGMGKAVLMLALVGTGFWAGRTVTVPDLPVAKAAPVVVAAPTPAAAPATDDARVTALENRIKELEAKEETVRADVDDIKAHAVDPATLKEPGTSSGQAKDTDATDSSDGSNDSAKKASDSSDDQ